MSYGSSQDIVMIEAKMAARRLGIRALWSLAAGLAVIVGRICFFGPPSMLTNLFNYAWASIIVMFEREVRSGGPERHAIFEMVKYQYLIIRQKQAWVWTLGGAAAVLLVSFATLTYLFWRRGTRDEIDRVTRGSRLLTPRLHNRIIRRSYGRKPPNIMGRPLKLGKEKMLIPEALQYLHFAFTGASGGGKSTAIQEIMEQAIARGDKGLVVDLDGSLYSKFGRPGDHILSLRDPRSEAWDFWHEVGIPEEAMAASMIEEPAGGNDFFWRGGRAALSSLLRQTESPAELWSDFKKSVKELRAKLDDTDELSSRVIGSNDSDQADGVIGTAVLDFSFLKELNQWAEGRLPFSIARWINDHQDQSWTYILFTEADLEISRPLMRVWFDIACLATLQRDDEDPDNRQTWIILDEVKTLKRLSRLPSVPDRGRKCSVSLVLGYQAMSQFEEIYGEKTTQSILQGLQNQFHFHGTEKAAAEYASELMGEQEVEQTSLGASYDTSKDGNRGSYNRTLVRKRLLMAEDIRALEPLSAFVRLVHHQPVKLKFAIKKRPRRQGRASSQRRLTKPSAKPVEALAGAVKPKYLDEAPLPGANPEVPTRGVPEDSEGHIFLPESDNPL